MCLVSSPDSDSNVKAFFNKCSSNSQTTEFKADGGLLVSRLDTSRPLTGAATGGNLQPLTFNSNETPVEFGPEFGGRVLNATGSFPADRTQRAQITGTAEAGATVIIKMGNVEIDRVTADATDGSYTWNVPAPMQGGTKSYTVSQIVDGTESGNVQVDLNYGTAVSISSPTDGAPANAGTTQITGRGENGSAVTVGVNGTNLAPVTVTNGTWTAQADLRRGENTITATQASKGANSTTTSITVNPGESNTRPFEVTSPQTDTTVGGPTVEFTGKAEPGTTVRVLEGASVVMTQRTTNADENWSGTSGNLDNGLHNLTVEYTEPGQQRQTQPLNITVENGTVQDFRVTSPTDGGTVNSLTFDIEGIGTTGTNVNVIVAGTSNVVMRSTPVDGAGDWKGTGTLPGNGTYTLRAQYKEPGTGNKKTVDFRVTVATGVERDFEVLEPGDNDTVTSNVFQMRGVGTTGTTLNAIRVGQQNAIMTGVVIGPDGTWEGTATLPNRDGDHRIKVQYREPGNPNKQVKDLTVKVASGVVEDFQITSPSDGDVITTNPQGEVTFTGRATTGTTVNVVRANGDSVIRSVEAGPTGNWTGTGNFPNGENTYRVQYREPGKPKQTVEITLDIKRGTVVPFALTSYQNNEVVVDSDGIIDFAGNATTGTKVNIIRKANAKTVMKSVTADHTGKWKGTSDFAIPAGATWEYTIQYLEPGVQGTQKTDFTITVNRG